MVSQEEIAYKSINQKYIVDNIEHFDAGQRHDNLDNQEEVVNKVVIFLQTKIIKGTGDLL